MPGLTQPRMGKGQGDAMPTTHNERVAVGHSNTISTEGGNVININPPHSTIAQTKDLNDTAPGPEGGNKVAKNYELKNKMGMNRKGAGPNNKTKTKKSKSIQNP